MKDCKLCKREVERTSRHHLIPRKMHSNKWFKKNFEREQMHQTVDLCRDCHKQIHVFATEKELGRHYYTLEKLMEHEKIRKFVEWIKVR